MYSIEFGWRLPLKLDGIKRSIRELKPNKNICKLNNEADAQALYNNVNWVSLDEFCRIATCKCAKEA